MTIFGLLSECFDDILQTELKYLVAEIPGIQKRIKRNFGYTYSEQEIMCYFKSYAKEKKGRVSLPGK